MSGLGLSNAVRMYQQGADWRQERDDREKRAAEDAKQRATRDAAGAAWKSAMTPPMVEVDGGVDDDGNPMPKISRPDPKWDRQGAVIKGLGAVADVYGGAGDLNSFLAAEAKAAPMRAERRKTAIDMALATYRVDKDPIRLAQAVYPHIYDGREITNSIKRNGKIEFSLSDGSKSILSPDELVAGVEYLRDPVAAAEYEAKTRFERFKSKLDTEGKIAVEERKHVLGLEVLGAQHKNQLGLAEANNASAERRANIGAGATLGAAKIRAGADGDGGAVGPRLQSTRIDASGYMVGIFRDGTTKRLVIDGKPVRSSDYQRHINVLQKQLSESREGRRKTVEELRQQAEAMLLGGAASDGDDGSDFSHLWN